MKTNNNPFDLVEVRTKSIAPAHLEGLSKKNIIPRKIANKKSFEDDGITWEILSIDRVSRYSALSWLRERYYPDVDELRSAGKSITNELKDYDCRMAMINSIYTFTDTPGLWEYVSYRKDGYEAISPFDDLSSTDFGVASYGSLRFIPTGKIYSVKSRHYQMKHETEWKLANNYKCPDKYNNPLVRIVINMITQELRRAAARDQLTTSQTSNILRRPWVESLADSDDGVIVTLESPFVFKDDGLTTRVINDADQIDKMTAPTNLTAKLEPWTRASKRSSMVFRYDMQRVKELRITVLTRYSPRRKCYVVTIKAGWDNNGKDSVITGYDRTMLDADDMDQARMLSVNALLSELVALHILDNNERVSSWELKQGYVLVNLKPGYFYNGKSTIRDCTAHDLVAEEMDRIVSEDEIKVDDPVSDEPDDSPQDPVKSKPKSGAQRVKEAEERKKEQGLVKGWAWVYPEDRVTLRALAADLRKNREAQNMKQQQMPSDGATIDVICVGRSSLDEKNDCAVVAVSVTTGTPYKATHQAFKESGREDFKPTYKWITFEVIKQMGFKVNLVFQRSKEKKGYTKKTIAKAFPKGRYLVFVNRHVYPLVDGVIHDIVDNQLQRVKLVYQILAD